MKILLSLLFILLIFATSGPQIYFEWKRKAKRILFVQFGIIGLAVILGIYAIYSLNHLSISHLLNMMSPFGT